MGSEGENEEGYMVLSKVRTGLKREFQFALRSQNEIGLLSRTRVRKRVTELPNSECGVSDTVTNCGGGVEKERIDEVTDCDGVNLKVVPRVLKELLETGLLEGMKVKYVSGLKCGRSRKELAGVIKRTGVLCFCEGCKGDKIITPAQFELHAGSANKRPADYIHLENGKTIRDVLNACRNVKLNSVAAVILNAISSSPGDKPAFCRGCGEPIAEAGTERIALLCCSCSVLDASRMCLKLATDTKESTVRSVERVPLHRTCNIPQKGHSSSSRSHGKLTRKDVRVNRLVFRDDLLPDGTELAYFVNEKKLLSGYKKDSGIFCQCCQTVVTPSQFEAHAGCASRRKPYDHIYLSNGASLREIALNISKDCMFSTDENDDLCNICQRPGNLLCCDACPRAFHIKCASVSSIPENKWYCRHCEGNFQMEKFSERNPNAIAAGRVPGVNPMEQIANHCIRIVQNFETQASGCVLCRSQAFCTSEFGPGTVIICDQCEREYHIGCLRENNMQDLKELPEGNWFCCSDCERIKSALTELVELREQQLPDDLIHVLMRKFPGDAPLKDDLKIRWRVLHGRSSCLDETGPLLSKAVSVFHEQFSPICYGNLKQDLIPHMVYGRDLMDKEFGGMYCAVLSVNSIIVSTGVFRVLGEKVAEIPLVATSKDCVRKGYFQSLYACLERFLKNMDVKNLLLPSAEETRSLWLNRFGFTEMPKEEFDEMKSHYNSLMNFAGTSMLCKRVPESKH